MSKKTIKKIIIFLIFAITAAIVFLAVKIFIPGLSETIQTKYGLGGVEQLK